VLGSLSDAASQQVGGGDSSAEPQKRDHFPVEDHGRPRYFRTTSSPRRTHNECEPQHLPAFLFSLSLAVCLHGVLHVGEELCLLLGGSSDGVCCLFGGTAQCVGLLP
jgi:hypothetical protein